MLGLWIEQTEGAKFWLGVLNELRTRGVDDILIAVVDGLKGFPEAIEAVFPHTMTQTCIVHLIRNSLDVVGWKDRKALVASLKAIYQAPREEAAEAALDAFEASPWAQRYPMIAPPWRRAWAYVVPFFAFPPAIRKRVSGSLCKWFFPWRPPLQGRPTMRDIRPELLDDLLSAYEKPSMLRKASRNITG